MARSISIKIDLYESNLRNGKDGILLDNIDNRSIAFGGFVDGDYAITVFTYS